MSPRSAGRADSYGSRCSMPVVSCACCQAVGRNNGNSGRAERKDCEHPDSLPNVQPPNISIAKINSLI
ncbi:hypothetical protein FA15DRAFT_54048 [Coprinopsis marcescibilis]|uniref:Uncharacterized protein n=1 Tax=Coprinopsis marcescibilis TaxID=230819 RepID=A0A5C3KNZ4_COPMA|nr:hypothetical protein FA15DRAFT_54048 [Coprinopsis marcescibilis]